MKHVLNKCVMVICIVLKLSLAQQIDPGLKLGRVEEKTGKRKT
jgi:hypothetical protein